jgi:SAM-dependent methyltransferase
MISEASKLTAIKRKKLSSPMKYLYDECLISSNHLDYGCGRGDDADTLFCDKYDPNWFPEKPQTRYDSITCVYVLNVIEEHKEREAVIKDIKGLLNPGGKAYIAVRRDNFKEGYTSRGTWQGMIELPQKVVRLERGKFCIYEIDKEE